MAVMMLMVRMVVMVMATNTVKMEKMETNSARIGVVELDQSWPLSDEIKAILGNYFFVTDKVKTHLLLFCWHLYYNVLCRRRAGVLGGVGSMGTVFLLVVLTQRYCCRRRHDKEEAGG